MLRERKAGEVHPGIKWFIFTLRIPFLHIKPAWPEFWQGCFVTTSISFSLTPILVTYFGLSFNEALAMCFLQAMLIYLSPLLFGEPFIAGWITPAFPLVLAFITGTAYDTPELRFQALAAMTIDFAVITGVLGVTGLGKKFISLIPQSVKAGVLLGAALAAMKRIFITDIETFLSQPATMTTALVVCIVMAFSIPFSRYKDKSKIVKKIATFGYLPGLFFAALAGIIFGELTFDIQWGFIALPFGDMWQKTSPLAIGWPDVSMYISGLSFAFIAYIAVFGDMITGIELVKDFAHERKDEKIDINTNRSHLALSIRNFIMAIIAPFFTTQGHLWTGTQVVIFQRWREGRESMDSIYSGIASFTLFGLPALMVVAPMVSLLTPLLKIALVLTLALTAIACSSVAFKMIHKPMQLTVALMTAFALVSFSEPWIGILVGISAALVLIGLDQVEMNEETG